MTEEKLYENELMIMSEEDLDWNWINREVDQSFFDTAGKLDPEESANRYNQIPDGIKLLAVTLINAAVGMKRHDAPSNCLLYRTIVYDVYRNLKEKGIDIKLPHGWFMDGVMIEPEWIVRITNGIIGWKCDPEVDNPDICGLDNCRFRDKICKVKEKPVPIHCIYCNRKIYPNPKDFEVQFGGNEMGWGYFECECEGKFEIDVSQVGDREGVGWKKRDVIEVLLEKSEGPMSKECLIDRAKREWRVDIDSGDLNTVLKSLFEKRMAVMGSKGILWTHNDNEGLRKAAESGRKEIWKDYMKWIEDRALEDSISFYLNRIGQPFSEKDTEYLKELGVIDDTQ